MVRILQEHEVAGLGEAWDALVGRGDDPRAYSRHTWLLARRRHFGRGRLCAVTAWRGEQLVGALPLELTRERLAVAATLVDGARGGHGDLLVAKDDDDAARALVAALPGVGADLLVLPMYREGSAAERALLPRGLVRMPSVDTLPRLRLSDGWAAAEARLVSRQTRRVRARRERQLAACGRVEAAVLADAAMITPQLDAALRLHRLRWPAEVDGSALGTPAGAAFLRAVVLDLAREGLVRMSTIQVDGTLVACQIAFLLDGQLALWRVHHDQAYRRYGVGFQAIVTLLRELEQRGERLEVVEFGPGEEPWKESLTTERLVLPAGVVPLTPRGRADARRRLLLAHARRRLKHLAAAQRARAYVRARRVRRAP